MRTRHLSTPHYEFAVAGGVMRTGRIQRVSTWEPNGRWFGYGLADECLGQSLLRPLTSIETDVLDVGVAVYVADRLAPRAIRGDARPPDDRWHRSIRLTLPVRHPDVWNRTPVLDLLGRYLHFLTDDNWSFRFVRRTADHRAVEAISCLFSAPLPDSVLLFSGGLDSLLGLITLVRSGTERVMPLTVSTSPRIGATVARVLSTLPEADFGVGRRVLPTRVELHLSSDGANLRLRDECEPSQRARSLMYLAAAAATGHAAGLNRVDVLENGVGAIGLPMSGDHWGSRATKAMHPHALALLSELCSLVFGWPFEICNHGIFETKRQLVSRLVGAELAEAVEQSSSCDRATSAGSGEPCGYCTSCIERHVALMGVSTVRTHPIDAGDGLHLTAARFHQEVLREASSRRSWNDLRHAFPTLDTAYASLRHQYAEQAQQRLMELFASHVVEMDGFFASIDQRTPGRPPTLRLQPVQPIRLPLVG